VGTNVDCSGERLTCVPKSSGFWNTFWYNIIPWGTPYSWATTWDASMNFASLYHYIIRKCVSKSWTFWDASQSFSQAIYITTCTFWMTVFLHCTHHMITMHMWQWSTGLLIFVQKFTKANSPIFFILYSSCLFWLPMVPTVFCLYLHRVENLKREQNCHSYLVVVMEHKAQTSLYLKFSRGSSPFSSTSLSSSIEDISFLWWIHDHHWIQPDRK
jgi:hypothetical protein